MFSLLPTLMGGSFNSGASLSALDRKPSAELEFTGSHRQEKDDDRPV
jgi:hypothetical protein